MRGMLPASSQGAGKPRSPTGPPSEGCPWGWGVPQLPAMVMLSFPGMPPAKAQPVPSWRRRRPREDELLGATETGSECDPE